MPDNAILNEHAGVPRHLWQIVWRGSPDVPRMLPATLRDRFLEVGADGVSTVIRQNVDLSVLPGLDEWRAAFPEIVYTPPATYTPLGELVAPRMVSSPGYVPRVAAKGRIPAPEEGAWPDAAAYEEWAAVRRRREAAIDALGEPYSVREGCERTVDMALGHIDAALADGQATRPDLELWWDRIELYAPGHPILAFRAWIDDWGWAQV